MYSARHLKYLSEHNKQTEEDQRLCTLLHKADGNFLNIRS